MFVDFRQFFIVMVYVFEGEFMFDLEESFVNIDKSKYFMKIDFC